MVKLSTVRRLCFVRGGKECTPTAIFLNGDLNVRGEEAGDGEGGKNEKERGGSFVLLSVAVKKRSASARYANKAVVGRGKRIPPRYYQPSLAISLSGSVKYPG